MRKRLCLRGVFSLGIVENYKIENSGCWDIEARYNCIARRLYADGVKPVKRLNVFVK